MLKLTQTELNTCQEALPSFEGKSPSAAPASAEKMDLLKHALAHNIGIEFLDENFVFKTVFSR